MARHKTFRPSRLVSFLVLLSLSLPAIAFSTSQRERRTQEQQTVVPRQSASPSPTPTPAATPLVSSSPDVAQPEVQPKWATSARTLGELQTRIAEVLRRPELSSAMVGIKVISLESGHVLFEENASKLLRPASNMKLYTVATALDRLSPDYRFTTSIYGMKPDANGVVRGNMTVYVRGDRSFAARFNNGDYLKGIDDLAARIVAAGVKRVEGDLVGDETYFSGPQYGAGWEWEDLTWYYGAEITPLTANDNALDLFIKPGAAVGDKAVVTTGPPDPLLTIVNQVTTTAESVRRDISVYRDLGEHSITITGTIPLRDRGYNGGIGISHPAMLFVYLLRSS